MTSANCENQSAEAAFSRAKWVGCDNEAPIIFKKFYAENVLSAKLYISALGFGESYINGVRVGDCEVSPVWADYHRRDLSELLYPINDTFSYSHYYQTYDVTTLIKEGVNVFSAWLGNGWYNQHCRNVEGNLEYGTPKMKCCLLITEKNGTQTEVNSDETFLWSESPIFFNNVYYGEKYDGRINVKSILEGRAEGKKVTLHDNFDSVLRRQTCPPDKVIRTVKPKCVFKDSQRMVYDVGENTSGRIRIFTDAKEGTVITASFAEKLSGTRLDYSSCGGENQIQSMTYISSGSTSQEYAPKFCIFGFRYFEILGDVSDIVCEVIHADVKETGFFRTSSENINRFIDAYKNSQLSNLHYGVPSDCPHRERLGYTGDGQLTAGAACLFFDMREFYKKWLRDIADCQCKVSGHVQHTAPFYGGGGGPCGYGGAIIYLPWKLYLHYGSVDILKEYYSNMKMYLSYIKTRCEDNIVVREEDGGWCLGDWCTPGEMKIPPEFANTCIYAEQLGIMAKISTVTGNQTTEYAKEHTKIKKAIRRNFFKDNQWCGNVQGADVFAYRAGAENSEYMIESLKRYKTEALDTGIFATPYLFETLFELGMGDIAVSLMERTDFPSFGYMFQDGGATLWESFDGKESNNHPMFGATAEVLAQYLTGVCADEVDSETKTITIKPFFAQKISFAKAQLQTRFGELHIKWERLQNNIIIDVQIPECTTAKLVLKNCTKILDGGSIHKYTVRDKC